MTSEVNERIMECGSCGKASNKARWIGEAILESGERVEINGIVGFDGDTDCLTLDPLIEALGEEVEVDGCTGDAYCPFCNSNDFY